MVKVTALFGKPDNSDAFEEYYEKTHTPLVHRLPNIEKFDRAKVVGTPDGSDPPYYRTADLWFESMEKLQEDLSSPDGEALARDLQNFASGGVVLLISETS